MSAGLFPGSGIKSFTSFPPPTRLSLFSKFSPNKHVVLLSGPKQVEGDGGGETAEGWEDSTFPGDGPQCGTYLAMM